MPSMHVHSFHIPVMGTGFSVDAPLKVAKYGISSVISLVDDTLIEQMRKFYTQKFNEPYVPIPKTEDDSRAKRITAYLDLINRHVQQDFEALKTTAFAPGTEITKYFELLPDESPLKRLYQTMLKTSDEQTCAELQKELRNMMQPGEIQVNIMTKLDRIYYDGNGQPLPAVYSDAMAALRGFAKSQLASAIVFSAGLNQRLYNYVSEFKDFYADAKGFIKKKIILKVSDFRSSLVQGKIFAKKGLWVSEYRVESGLNCGGHAFPTQGRLLGPILEEFKNKRQELIAAVHKIYNQALELKTKTLLARPHPVRVTAQGGVGTAQEHKFLQEYYDADGVGWGSPFLLCPEVTNVEDTTLKKLSAAGEGELYLSRMSPLGIPFHGLKDDPFDQERRRRIAQGHPGSPCPKGLLVSNTEFSEKPICVASRQYQEQKVKQILEKNLSSEETRVEIDRIVVKACLCHELGAGVLIKNHIEDATKRFAVICPGPNLAYFSKIVTLAEMVAHIYGRLNIRNSLRRPHMFIKEARIYIDYFMEAVKEAITNPTAVQQQSLCRFKQNLQEGLEYYRELFSQRREETESARREILDDLQVLGKKLQDFVSEHQAFFALEINPGII